MNTRNGKINYQVDLLKKFFTTDFEAWRDQYSDDTTNRLSIFRSEIVVVDDFIKYVEGTNNWCIEDLDLFEQELLESNPKFQEFKSFLTVNGYQDFAPIEVGTFWVVQCAMFDELLNMGFADLDRSAPANSWVEAIRKYERNEKRREKQKGVLIENERGGRKYNIYNSSYEKWIQRLLPSLETLHAIGNQKEGLIFIGMLLEASGHSEFRQQYERECRETIIERQVKSENRWIEFETIVEHVPVPFREYLHNRMKTIMTRMKKRKRGSL
jgi:hypothetical protein